MDFCLRAPFLFHLITMLLCFGYMHIVIHHVDSQTTGTSILSCIDTERFALLNFKSILVFGSKRNLSYWTHENMDCCRWEGIRCNKAGRVVKIDLHGPSYNYLGFGHNHIGGDISPSLLHLSYLNYLDLSNNDFTKVPEFFGSLKRLTYLNVSNNPLSGKIPHQLGNLSALESLDLNLGYAFSPEYSMHVDSMAWVAGLTSLKYLDMSYIKMGSAKDWVHSILKLPSLTSLYLRWSDAPFPASTEMNSSTSLQLVDLSGMENLNIIALSPLLNGSTKLVDLTFSTFNQQPSPIPDYLVKFVSIKYLHLSHSQLEGTISETFSHLPNLITLDMSYNDFEGVIPRTFGNLTNLKTLSLSWNRLNNSYGFFQSGSNSLQELCVNDNKLQGSLPNLSKFPNLRVLDVSSNHLNGTYTESLFRNLTNLQFLSLSSNSLTLNFSTTFTPSFQLQVLQLRANRLGKIFPHWLRTQKNLTTLDISDSGILDNIPCWVWCISSRLMYLNVSQNSICGYLPPNSLSSSNVVDLSCNRFYGPLPSFSSTLKYLDVSDNAFSGGINFLCGVSSWGLFYLDLSNNSLTGTLQNCWKNIYGLLYLNLNNNKFTGTLPDSIGLSWSLRSLFLRNNNFFGKLPQSLANCTRLYFLDLGKNKFSGRVPDWIGTNVTYLMVLRLNSNNFEGNITTSLCCLKSLQILDLSSNNISGIIPSCLNNLTQMSSSARDLGLYDETTIVYDEQGNLEVTSVSDEFTTSTYWKELQLEFSSKTSHLLRLIDLSTNKFTGFIPKELTTLDWLDGLNLSHNVLIGSIPSRIGQMRMLESLDFSHNLLSGEIPLSLNNLTTLSYLDLSFNKLTGSILVSTQLTTFDATKFMGNPGLCGDTLPSPCHHDKDVTPDSPEAQGGDDNEFPWMYITTILGFIVGFWGVCGTLLINKSLEERYFQFLTHITERLHVGNFNRVR